eukprot:s123_g6.t1
MPPKIRRPAAAVGVRRRPAAVEVPPRDPWTLAAAAKLEDFATGASVEIEGEYWEGSAQVCGLVTGAAIEEGQRYLRLTATGTKSEALLKHLSGSKDRQLQVHLCGNPCEAKTWREDLIHAARLKLVGVRREDWMDNLGEMRQEESDRDVNERLRKEAEEAMQELQRREKESKEEKEKKAEKKDKKKKKKKRRSQVKASAGKKDLTAVYGGTGIDPDPAVRKLVLKKAKRLRKRGKKKRKRSTESETSSTSSATTTSSEDLPELDLFEGERDTQRLWKKTPGALTLATVIEAQQSLLTRQGVHPEIHQSSLPPIMTQYYRTTLQPAMRPALSRECHHWSMMVDLLLQGEPARAADLGCQRLKSLEAYSRGVHLEVSRNLELVPPERSSLAGQAETSQAGKLAAEESKVASKTRYSGKGGEGMTPPPAGQKGKTKGDGKKGKSNLKGGKKGKDEEKEKQG